MKVTASISSRNIAVAGVAFVIGLLALVSLAAAKDRAERPLAPRDPSTFIPALLNSKTIRVTATCYLPDANGRLVKNSRMTVTFARPSSFRVEAIDLTGNTTHQEEPDLFVTDGATTSEYLSETNRYRTETIPVDRPFSLSRLTGVERKGLTSEIPNGFQRVFTPLAGESTTVKTLHMDRKPVLLVDRSSRPAPGSSETAVGRRLWYDWKTGLPIRYETYMVSSGRERTHQRVDYSGWTVDEPVASSTFAWKAPWSAQVYQSTDTIAPSLPALASAESLAVAAAPPPVRTHDSRTSGPAPSRPGPVTVTPQKVPDVLPVPVPGQ